ncbi:MAG: aquaporin [Ignavibacteria bacterium]|nr:aquaporin [Ignavibacteria bacterium]
MKKYIVEFIGAFFIVFCGTGAIIVHEAFTNSISQQGIALSFGLTVAVLIYLFSEISGAHFNPAVSIVFWRFKRLSGTNVISYILAQLLGAVSAAFVLHIIFPGNRGLGATQPVGPEIQSFLIELLFTFLLMLAILQASSSRRIESHTGLIIGGIIFLEALIGGPVSGASMNPARSFGPAVVSGNYHSLWIYLAAPVLGAMSAGQVFSRIHRD